MAIKSKINSIEKIALGGGCHWCTEGIFQSLLGVQKVEQGWVCSEGRHSELSEGVVIHFQPKIISLAVLIEIHLHTHSCTGTHKLREKYRSAIYIFDAQQKMEAMETIKKLQVDFENSIITLVLPYKSFHSNKAEYLNYFYTNPRKQFCQRYIHPKLIVLQKKYSTYLNLEKIESLNL